MIQRLAKSLAYSRTVHRLVEGVERALPPLRYWHRVQYERHFKKVYKWERLFSGVYSDREAALGAVPKDRPVGYDNAESAVSLGRHTPMLACEYPVIFWMSRLLGEGAKVVDLGGYLGFSYEWYRRFGIYPAGLRWVVYDVPAVVKEGKKILEAEPNAELEFTTEFAEATGADVLLASGSLQFCEESLAAMLKGLERMPHHVLVNKLAVIDGAEFFTLQNMGPSIAPYRVVQRAAFLAELKELGYEVVDAWQNPELTCYVPFHPEATVEAFQGYYLRRI